MTTEQKIIKNKVGLLSLAQELGNVSRACKVFGYSRDSFYRFKELYDSGGEQVTYTGFSGHGSMDLMERKRKDERTAKI